MGIITNIIIITFGILQIILFFKIWGMTNDIKQIKNKYLSSDKFKRATTPSDQSTKFKVGDLVIDIKTDKQMRIKDITEEGKYSCYINSGTIYVGDFSDIEIKNFD